MYDKKIFRSASFALPLICVGNLAVGGTGKSPMVEYLVRLLKDRFNVATLSRGYKRRTKGYALANQTSDALDIGDEPMQFHIKFPDVPVAVGEERLYAIPLLLHDRPETEVIILDDAFQHRAIKAGLNILLTDYSNLFTRDFYLPTGDLRDLKSQYKRADIIVVTKCDPNLLETERDKIIKEIDPLPGQFVFFAAMEYDQPYHILTGQNVSITEKAEVLLVSGIANPRPLKAMLEKSTKAYHLLEYPDHRIFTIDDLREIRRKFSAIDCDEKIILTTEKDAVRLVKFNAEIAGWPLYVIPVRHHFLYEDEGRFSALVVDFILRLKQTEKN
jgi:tetraacyldisaccharide 4'-kinase